MQEVLISIQPQWVEKILNGEKTIEIRKTMPKCELPCKVYIYCTKGKNSLIWVTRKGEELPYGDGRIADKTHFVTIPKTTTIDMWWKLGKVVAEFTLKQVDKLEYRHLSVSHINAYIPVDEDADYQWEKHSCVDYGDIVKYGKLAPLYAWHIDGLKIYNKPKELSEFSTSSYCSNYMKNVDITINALGDCVAHYEDNFICRKCKYFDGDFNICEKKIKTKTRPPQSWCYVRGQQ